MGCHTFDTSARSTYPILLSVSETSKKMTTTKSWRFLQWIYKIPMLFWLITRKQKSQIVFFIFYLCKSSTLNINDDNASNLSKYIKHQGLFFFLWVVAVEIVYSYFLYSKHTQKKKQKWMGKSIFAWFTIALSMSMSVEIHYFFSANHQSQLFNSWPFGLHCWKPRFGSLSPEYAKKVRSDYRPFTGKCSFSCYWIETTDTN